MQLTFYGHSCIAVEVNNKKLLFDPYISANELAKDIDINNIQADYILLSHAHLDHVADAEVIAKRTGACIIANYEIAMWYANKGIKNYQPMNTGGKWKFDFGTVKCVNAVHSSCLPDGSNGGNPMGFIIMSNEMNFYYAGDTALTMDMQLIPIFANIDFAVLPIGDNFTMGIDDAVQAAKMVQTKMVIGVHYDTFGFIKIDKQKAKELFKKNELELKLPAIGETLEITGF
ncbi:MAG TPA: metal-dependent hydrolase [Ferruginibacter sp.]|nr:metal-dependent hydrolase [Ferruginibacter sp.]